VPARPFAAPLTSDVSFLGFLQRTYGLTAMARFARAAVETPAAVALEQAFGRSASLLADVWIRNLQAQRRTTTTAVDFMRHLVPMLRPHWHRQVEMGMYMLVDVVAGLAMPLASKVLFDTILPQRDTGLLAVWLVIVPTFFILGGAASYRRVVVAGLVGELVQLDVMRRVFAHLQKLSIAFHTRSRSGDLLTRITSDVGDLQVVVGENLPQLVFNLAELIVSSVVLVLLNWMLGVLVLVLGIPVFAVIYSRTSNTLRDASRLLRDTFGSMSAFLSENLGAQTVVKSFSLESSAQKSFEQHLREMFRQSMRTIRLEGVLTSSTTLIYYGVRVVVLAVGALLVVNDRVTIGDLVAILWLVAQVFQPIISITGQYRRLISAAGAFDRVREILDEPLEVVEDPGAIVLPKPAHEIRLDHVTLRYGDGEAALRDVSLSIPIGHRVAIVGRSGSGKSSLVNLLLRLYDPQHGRILIDGRDVREVSLTSVRGMFAIVPQDTYLFNVSIRENIALGLAGASVADVERAAREAAVHEAILETESGYATLVGERGVRLSGGQRQRLAIARALARNPSVLVLDEATSALDTETEASILRTLDQAATGRTTIAITHRLSAAAHAHTIFVLDRGRLVEQGAYADLLAQRGVYWRLYSEQEAGIDTRALRVDPQRLANVPVLSSLDPAALAAIAARASVEEYAAGAIVVRQGGVADKLYVVASGQVEVLLEDGADSLRRIRVMGESSYFGEIALLLEHDARRTATVRTLERSELYSLHKEDFLALLKAHPMLADTVAELAHRRLRSGDGFTTESQPREIPKPG